MGNLVFTPVHSRREQKRFIDFPWQHYAGDPNWVPPLLTEQKKLLGYKHHPFYDDGAVQTFLAVQDGHIRGRIAAIICKSHHRVSGKQRGFFGFFESVDDQTVANGLFEAARGWLVERGMTSLRGPLNPSMNYECGLLVEGFHSPPTFMMTYNKPYYGTLLENWGLTKAQDLYAFWGHVGMLSKLDPKLAFIASEAKSRLNVKLRTMDKRHFRSEVELFLQLYNDSMVGTWEFTPLSKSEIRELAGGLKHLIAPELGLVAEVDGKPIGACLGLLDYNPRIKAINGRMFPFGFITLLRNKRAIKKMRVLSINVVPEYQRWGLGVVLLGGLTEPIQRWGIEEAEFSWVPESNTLSRGSLERGGAKRDKTYRIYDRALV